MKRIRKEDMRELLRVRKERRAEKKAAREEKRKNSKYWQTMQKVCDWMNRFSLVMHALLSVVIYFGIEAISRHSVAKAWEYMVASPWTFLFNTYLNILLI